MIKYGCLFKVTKVTHSLSKCYKSKNFQNNTKRILTYNFKYIKTNVETALISYLVILVLSSLSTLLITYLLSQNVPKLYFIKTVPKGPSLERETERERYVSACAHTCMFIETVHINICTYMNI